MSDSLLPHGLQHTRPPYPLPTLRVYSNSCPSNRWCHSTISSSVIPFSSRLQSFPASGLSQMVFSALHIRWPKYWSFSFNISPSNQPCPTLCDHMNCSPPGSSVHGIPQARIVEWVAISFSRESSWPRCWISISCIAGGLFTRNHQGSSDRN